MLFNLETVVVKNQDWKLVSGKGMDGSILLEASANRKDKEGKVWDKFDTIVEGGQIEADLWRNPSGKQYLFAPKVRAQGTTGSPGAMRGVAAAQARKAEGIEKTMDRKEAGIQVASAMRDATLITLASLRDTPFPEHADFVAQFKLIKDWYIKEWKETEKLLDQPF